MFSIAALQPALERALLAPPSAGGAAGGAAAAGVRSSLLLATDGRLLAHAFVAPEDGARDEVVAAVAAQAYQEYTTAAAGALDLPALRYLVLELEGRRLAAAAVDERWIVCLVCEAGASVAALRAATAALVADLREPLARVGADVALV